MRRFHFDVTDSTNVQARELAAQHPGELLLVTAVEQSSGRGRQGRAWHSPRGGAWLSLVWPLQRAVAEYAGISLAAAVAVHRAIILAAPPAAGDLRIKWPNDLLLGGRKVAGILCEALAGPRSAPSAGAVDAGAIIVGVWINADFDSDQLAGPLRREPTTLRTALGESPAAEVLVQVVAEQLVESFETFESSGLSGTLLDEFRRHLADIGEERTWNSPAGGVRGVIRGVDSAGRLLLAGPTGEFACETGELLE